MRFLNISIGHKMKFRNILEMTPEVYQQKQATMTRNLQLLKGIAMIAIFCISTSFYWYEDNTPLLESDKTSLTRGDTPFTSIWNTPTINSVTTNCTST